MKAGGRHKTAGGPHRSRLGSLVVACVAWILAAIAWTSAYPGFDAGWAAWFAWVPWLLWLEGRRRGRVFFFSWLLGLSVSLVSLAWIARLAPPGLFALVLYLGLYPGLFSLLATSGPGRRLRHPLVLASLWVSLEWALSHLFSGFPWLLFGHTQAGYPLLIQTADLGGVYAVSFLLVLVNATLAREASRVVARRASRLGGDAPPRSRSTGSAPLRAALARGLPAAAFGLGTLAYGAVRLAAPPDPPGPKIAGIQANISTSLKHDSLSQDQILRRHWEMSRAAVDAHDDLDLVVWSETMFPAVWDENERWATDDIRGVVRAMRLETRFLTGITAIGEGDTDPQSPDYRHWNRAILFAPDGSVEGTYDKVHLVPGGEYFPMRRWIPFRRQLEDAFYRVAGWYPTLTPGTGSPVLTLETEEGGVPFGTLICYDSIFPDTSRQAALAGARFLLNISNDGWYGRSIELDQILAITAFRAVESRRPVFRVTNTGISARIDSRGRIVERLHGRRHDGSRGVKEVRGTLVGRVGLGAGATVFLRFGEVFAAACALGALAWVLATRRRGTVRPTAATAPDPGGVGRGESG